MPIAEERVEKGESGSTLLARPELVLNQREASWVTDAVCSLVEKPAPLWWWVAAGAFGLLAAAVPLVVVYFVSTGLGVWGLQSPVFWGVAILNFVFWIEIGHAGTLISAILLFTRQRWRNSVNRASEAMTIFAVLCAAVFPLFHIGRQWMFWYLVPVPESYAVWQNFRAPLLWDEFAVGTYFTVSCLFWYFGLLPDIASLRDRATKLWKKRLYHVLCWGWTGSLRAWRHYEAGYLCIAGVVSVLVISVASVVSTDFATTVLPGWHTTIFPPDFITGAIFSGFAMIVTLMVPLRAAYPGLKDMITAKHLDNMAKVLLATGSLVGYSYLIELFIAWYGANPYERYTFWNRITGPDRCTYFAMFGFNVILPQIFWFRFCRSHPWILWTSSILINVGMWFERYSIIVVSLERDFLPASWRHYLPTWVDWGLFFGSVGLFFFLFLLFLRVLPTISVAEIKTLLAKPKGRRTREAAAGESGFRPGQEIYGLGAEFSSEEELRRASEETRKKGYVWWDAYAPYPIHGMERAMRLPKSRVSFFVLLGGLLGLLIGIAMVTATSIPRPPLLQSLTTGQLQGLFYATVVQGKPYFSLPAFVPVLLELTILFAAFSGFLAVVFLARLPRPHHPVWNWGELSRRATDDGLFLVIEARDPAFSPIESRQFLESLGGRRLTFIPR
ncbi:quinol:electron acceptor oxidoreductase subunit ActD [Verrucomicrobium sp. 3C]|uniref:quinol:electron acceptor oxidoreductase subunit ActD n=1 Tax=Verrucomicrobium sp. 3C TaxID=1134055 RepID=UPI00036B1608|nr:quinol:electron acceptor oxidoreductase subunit ActD [Verrucomicrobium sp. 3C]